jgi:hypothetical protein
VLRPRTEIWKYNCLIHSLQEQEKMKKTDATFGNSGKITANCIFLPASHSLVISREVSVRRPGRLKSTTGRCNVIVHSNFIIYITLCPGLIPHTIIQVLSCRLSYPYANAVPWVSLNQNPSNALPPLCPVLYLRDALRIAKSNVLVTT